MNAIAPGWIATALTQPRTPLARWGTPADVARGAVFLSSAAASFITGTILAVDGGYMAVG